MNKRRALALALTTACALVAFAPAAAQAVPISLTFPAGTVTVDDPGPTSNTVQFTMPNSDTMRAFIKTSTGAQAGAHIALGNATALGVPFAVYTEQSTASCQVYSGTTFGEADIVTGTQLVFNIRKDELAPDITVALEDSAGGPANCAGFDGSPGRPLTFDPANTATIQWQQPGDAANLRAIPGPHAITLAWTPPADALGVKYEISELQPNGSFLAFDAVGGSSTTINNVAPGVPHTYMIHAFRQWGGPWQSPDATGPVTAFAGEFPPAAPVAGGGATTVTIPNAKAATKTSTASAKRPATPRARGRRRPAAAAS